MPIIILTIIDIIILTAYFNQTLKISTVIIYLMNLQGIQFISYWISKPFFKEITNLGSLWFATIIILCYLQIPFLQKIREKYIANKSTTWMIKYGVILACAYAVDYIFEVNLVYFLVFDLGYMISACLEGTGRKFIWDGKTILKSFNMVCYRSCFSSWSDNTPFYNRWYKNL